MIPGLLCRFCYNTTRSIAPCRRCNSNKHEQIHSIRVYANADFNFRHRRRDRAYCVVIYLH